MAIYQNKFFTHNNLQSLKEFYNKVYEEGDIEVNPFPERDTLTEYAYKVNVINAPYNDDSVKQLNKILQVIASK